MTFAVPEGMEAPLSKVKKEMFYDRNQSDMIRELVMAGMRALDEKAAKEKECGRAS